MKSKTDDRLRTRRAPTAGDKRLLNALLVILVLLQPFLDNYYLYTDKVAAYTHGVTVPPLLVLLTVAVLSAYYFFKYRGGQTGRLLFWYFVICAAYFVLHHISCSSFVSYVPGNFNYSLSHEAYYVARLLTPMLLIYLTFETGLDSGAFTRASCVMGAVCSAVLIVTNLTGTALCAYTNEPICGSILRWSTILTKEDLLPKFFASKAFFSYANQISVVLDGLFPLLCYQMAKNPKWYNGLNLVAMIVAMLMLGTMTAAIGVVLELGVLAAVGLVWLIFRRKTLRVYKKRLVACAIAAALMIGILAGLLPACPAVRNMSLSQKNNLGNKMGHFDLNLAVGEMTSDQYKEYCTFVLYNYAASGIAWRYVYVYYPYERDPAFWVAMIRNYTVGDNQNYRSLETRVIQRIVDVDGSKWDKWFGISATRETNIVKIERDILAQYYSMGIFGVVLFFGAYFLLMLLAVAVLLRSMLRRRQLPLFQTLLTMSFCVMMVMGYYCGNSLDMTFLSTYLGVSAGMLLSVSLGREQAEAGKLAKGFYYFNTLGAKKTAALVKENRADGRHARSRREEALRLYDGQKAAVKASLDGKTVFVYTPTVEWHYLYQRCQQMASCAAAREGCAVLFLSTQRHYDDEAGMTELKPGVWLVNAALADRLDELCAGAKTVVSCVYNITSGLDCLSAYHSDKLVYEYVDDLRFIVSDASDFTAYRKLHAELTARADLTVATAEKLYDEIAPTAKQAVLLPNAGDYDFFAAPAAPVPELAGKLKGYACVLEYYGALASWFDYETVRVSAKKHPDWCWLLVGREIGGDLKKSGVGGCKNVVHVPAVPYAELPRYVALADILTIPFVINQTTMATSPVKLFEYMAAGKPILTSDLPECRGYESVRRYETAEDLDTLVPRLMKLRRDPEYLELCDREARENTWNARMDEVFRRLGL
ncbi:MAG: O-antigen ligase family protein [Oscillospiraceae bacterium]|nr:O-antigen ligase family protein [Oscillospiraceae bacterium]